MDKPKGREVVRPKRSDAFVTEDLSTAAYLMMRDLPLNDAQSRPRRGVRFEFRFLDGAAARKLLIDYVNSEARKFDDAVRVLKKLMRDDNTPAGT